MKLALVNLFFIGLVACAPRIVENEDKDTNLQVEIGDAENRNGPISGLLNTATNLLNFNPLEASRCENQFSGLDPLKLIRLQSQIVYYFPPDKLSYSNAKSYCETKGMRLAVLESLGESIVLAEYVSTLYDKGAYAWIGLRATTAGSGEYFWEYTNAPLTYGHWYDGEPTTGDCIEFEADSVLASTGWITATCTDVDNFICEVPARCSRYLKVKTATFDDLY